MLLKIENASEEEIKKLLEYAYQQNIDLSFVEEDAGSYATPGKPLSHDELRVIVKKGSNGKETDIDAVEKIIQALPGKPLSSKELTDIIEKSRDSGSPIPMKDAFKTIRKNLYGG